MNGHVTPDGLWLPGERKRDGGSYFDDELGSAETVFKNMAKDLVQHLNERPDHIVFVGTSEDRARMREVFNWWVREGMIGHNPTIKIDYGVPEGGIRVAEDRG